MGTQRGYKIALILIPPSEGKLAGGDKPPLKSPSPATCAIIKKLHSVSPAEWGKLLGVKGKTLDNAIIANKHILSSKTMPAIERYTGVVYSAIDYPTLSKKGKDFFNRHVRIVSAVFGLVRADDLIPDYKLKIEKLGCDKFWHPILTEKTRGDAIIDLLPHAHKKAVDLSAATAVDFHVFKNGKKIPAGHAGKHIKGRFIRYLVENQSTSLKTIQSFSEDEFKWKDGVFINT